VGFPNKKPRTKKSKWIGERVTSWEGEASKKEEARNEKGEAGQVGKIG